MILKSVISFLIFILEGAAKLISFLFSALGLWIPAVYSLLFVLGCAITGTDFSEVLLIFYAGLFISFLLSVAIATLQVLRAREKRRIRAAEKTENMTKVETYEGKEKKKRRGDKSEPQPQQFNPQQGYAQPYPPQGQQGYAQPYPPQGQQGYVPPYPPQNEYNGRDAYPPQNGYAQDNAPKSLYEQAAAESNAQSNFGGYYNAQNEYAGQPEYNGVQAQSGFDSFGQSAYSAQQGAGADMYQQGEYGMPTQQYGGFDASAPTYNTPRIYRTKKDPNVLLYEFSDRIVFYRKTLNGQLEHMFTEIKQRNGQ